MINLRRYFNMTDEEKIEYLPQEYPYFIKKFLDNQNVEYDDNKREWEIVENLEFTNKELYKLYGDYLFKMINSHNLPMPDAEYPTWSFFDKPTLIRNKWMIHFTNDAESIASEGFKYGVDDMTKLGLTTHLGEFEKKFGGYNFAFPVNNFYEYGAIKKYGKEAIVFQASGLGIHHYGDNEYQIIFYGNTARNIIPIIKNTNTDEWEITNKNTLNAIYKSDNLKNIIKWIQTNFNQYKSKLVHI